MTIRSKVSYVIATYFGVGYFPFASGTAGSAAALPLAFAIVYLGGFWALAAATAIIYALGTLASLEVLKYTGHDPAIIVIDEVAGQFASILPVANFLRGNTKDMWLYIVAFFLFRLFDIVKPWPASFFDQKITNAHGVMLDDIFAGIYAAAALFGIKWFFSNYVTDSFLQ